MSVARQQQSSGWHRRPQLGGPARARWSSAGGRGGGVASRIGGQFAVRVGLVLVLTVWIGSFSAVFFSTIEPSGKGNDGLAYSAGVDRLLRPVAGERARNGGPGRVRAAAAARVPAEDGGASRFEAGGRPAARIVGRREPGGAAAEEEEEVGEGGLKAGGAGEERAIDDPRKDGGAAIDLSRKSGGGNAGGGSANAGVMERLGAAGGGSAEGEYHRRADAAALAYARTPVKISTTASNTTDPSGDYVDMRDLTATLPFDNPDGGAWKQGWNVEPVPLDPNNPLKVFVLPHSHCDPGWIKTFDEYFRSQTSGILTSVYNALRKDPRRKFIWAEISYFEWWWREQSDATREETRELVRAGQLEFVTGGWVQPDEANTQRYAIEVQLQEGHDWLRETFGEGAVPKYGWSIDPFGYSPTMADVLHDYGFEGMLIQRVHYAVKKELAKRKHLEFNWRQTYDESGERDVFTHVMPFYSYDVPHTCGPDPSVCCQFDFARIGQGRSVYGNCPWGEQPVRITPSNVADRARMLLDQYRRKASLYRSNVVLHPLGSDFRYRTDGEAEDQYNNYAAIMDHLNEHVPGVEVQFGTLSDYFRAVRGTFEPPILKGSFFTYADRDEDYWSGYFTSRAFDKALDRKLERVLYAASAMGASVEEMREPRRSLSLFQHHDGVTGTAKDRVVEDYARYMRNAIDKVQGWMAERVRSDTGDASLQPCWKSKAPRSLGHFACDFTQPTYVFNPLLVDQICGEATIPPRQVVKASLPCGVAFGTGSTAIKFDPKTGMMISPLKEEWMVWKVKRGGAYLFFPGQMVEYLKDRGERVTVEEGGYVVSTSRWKRTIVEKRVPDGSGRGSATAFDFIFTTNLQTDNEEWFVRFTAPVENSGVFHTDLNGANFDTHHFRKDLPIQSQVFPMPTLASIEDSSHRFTVLSEHAQGTASLQDGSIDVWLDRRLLRDDERGLGQGVRDNVLTRTRLRLLLETEGYDIDPTMEFEITQLCKSMWDELNHPLEVFGSLAAIEEGDAGQGGGESAGSIVQAAKKHYKLNGKGQGNVVPFVYMVHKRVDTFKLAIDSLRNSDFPRETAPLVISHDGNVTEMVEYVNSLKTEGFNVVQIFHPHACYDHPKSFPADAAELNDGYKGDTYGNPRSSWATCLKHHWTWMMKEVFDHMDFGSMVSVDAMLFLEEDYVVSPTVYETVTQGLYLASKNADYFGVVLDITNAGISGERGGEDWHEIAFHMSPMAIGRKSWQKIVDAREEFCKRDDYNWDWSLVWLQSKQALPYKVLAPSKAQVRHIGVDGMHINEDKPKDASQRRMQARMKNAAANWQIPQPWHGTGKVHEGGAKLPKAGKPNGGFGHPKDHEHCLKILSPTWLLPQ